MTWEHIELEIRDAVATVTLNRPEALNAFAGTMRSDLLAAIETAAEDARALVVTGAGRAFCSGGDVRYMSELRRAGDVDALRPLIEQGKRVVQRLRTLPIPTLASVGGVAAGAGLGLALACDFRIASDRARFGATFSRIGLHPDWGCSYFLARMAGPSVARELVLTGRLFDVAEARALGLVNWQVEAEDLARATQDKALELSKLAPIAVAEAKKTIELAESAALDEVLDREEQAQLACFRSDDALEGIRAFEEKRAPEFEGS